MSLRGRAMMQARLDALIRTLGTAQPPAEPSIASLTEFLTEQPSARELWLIWAVLTADLPTMHQVRWAQRQVQLFGTARLISRLMSIGRRAARLHGMKVEIVTGEVLVDVFHTAQTELATGIQRVARETAKRWDSNHSIRLVSWTSDGRALRPLSQTERARALFGTKPGTARESIPRTRIVPWGGHYILPELGGEPWRTERLGALAEYSGAESGVIGFDCVPLTSVETVGEGMPAAFARNLVAVARMTRICTISVAAGDEYSGWKHMLAATGLPGPEIRPIGLATSSGGTTLETLAAASERMGLEDGEPMILVVGSHEPRKNHLAILAAAESLWAEDLRFRLVFIGGNSWKSEQFEAEVKRLQGGGRSVIAVSAISDSLLWAAYRLARFTVFPSLNEGFGLPIAESLGCGTPVVTSCYGSMREIAEAGGGALLVDPYDDASIAAGMRTLLTDDGELARLSGEAAQRIPRSWDDYASELWAYFVQSGGAPED